MHAGKMILDNYSVVLLCAIGDAGCADVFLFSSLVTVSLEKFYDDSHAPECNSASCEDRLEIPLPTQSVLLMYTLRRNFNQIKSSNFIKIG